MNIVVKKRITNFVVKRHTRMQEIDLEGSIIVKSGVFLEVHGIVSVTGGQEFTRFVVEPNALLYVNGAAGAFCLVGMGKDSMVSFALDPGQLTIDESCVGGSVVARGVGDVINEGDVKLIDRVVQTTFPTH